MNIDDANLVHDLLIGRRVLSLAVVDASRHPVIGMVPFVAEIDLRSALVHVSRLAPHGKVMTNGTPYAALIQGSDDITLQPGQIPRVRFNGRADLLERGTAAHTAGRESYLGRFPDSEVTFGLGDFDLYRLRFETGRLVAGFARTVNLKPETLARLAAERSG
jgi:putative heme iron utilization protein